MIKGSEIRPRLTVLGFFKNDFCDNERTEYFTVTADGPLQPKSLRAPAAKSAIDQVPAYSWLISWSHFANLLKQSVIRAGQERVPQSGGSGSLTLAAAPGCARTRADLTRLYLGELRSLTNNKGSDLLAFYIPDAVEVEGDAPSRDESTFLRLCCELGIDAFSMRPSLRAAGHASEDLYFAEGHWTPAAHRIAAATLAFQLRDHLAPRGAATREPANKS